MHILRTKSDIRTHDARAEIDRLMAEVHDLVSRSAQSGRDAVERALPAVAALQVVTANVDACNPSRRPGIATELVTVADAATRPRRDAVERGLAYTADSTMRRLTEQHEPACLRPPDENGVLIRGARRYA